jgi:glyoxylase-like metal-dependent hydrolase (beta-lactamase superfamily II)
MNQVEPSHTQMPQEMFPTYDADIARRHLAALDPVVFDPASGRLVITYQTYVVRTPRHTILVDTCTGEDKGYAPPMDFPKQPWLDGFRAAGLGFEDIDYVFCTHLHIDHCGWNTVLRDGRWVPTFPNAKYLFHKSLLQNCRARRVGDIYEVNRTRHV